VDENAAPEDSGVKARSLLICYLLIWATAGIYFYIWMWQMMGDLNRLTGRTQYDQKRMAKISCAVFLLDFAYCALGYSIIFYKSAILFDLFLALSFPTCLVIFVFFGYVIRLLIQFNKSIAALSASDEKRPATSAIIVLLFFFYFSAIPYLQNKLNSVIQAPKH
jgi:hypothetical protein